MSSVKACCVLLTPSGAQDLEGDLGHLFDYPAGGPMLRCASVEIDGAWLKLATLLSSEEVGPEIVIPAHCVRAVVKTADLVAWGMAIEAFKRPPALSREECVAFMRKTIAGQGGSHGAEIPISLLRGMCATTPRALFDGAVADLVEAGFLLRSATGTLTVA